LSNCNIYTHIDMYVRKYAMCIRKSNIGAYSEREKKLYRRERKLEFEKREWERKRRLSRAAISLLLLLLLLLLLF